MNRNLTTSTGALTSATSLRLSAQGVHEGADRRTFRMAAPLAREWSRGGSAQCDAPTGTA